MAPITRWDAIFRSYVGVSGVDPVGQAETNADKKYIGPTGKFAVLKYPPPARADVGNRTRDLRLTMAALYQLSYVGEVLAPSYSGRAGRCRVPIWHGIVWYRSTE